MDWAMKGQKQSYDLAESLQSLAKWDGAAAVKAERVGTYADCAWQSVRRHSALRKY